MCVCVCVCVCVCARAHLCGVCVRLYACISQLRAYLDIFNVVFQSFKCIVSPHPLHLPVAGQCMAWNGSVVSAAMPLKYQAQCWSELGSGPDLKETKDDHSGTSSLLVQRHMTAPEVSFV